MKLPQAKSFMLGVAASMLAVCGFYLWHHAGARGGVVGDSPGGNYVCRAFGPLSSQMGGSYTVKLIDKRTGQAVRHISITLSSTEETIPLRGGGGQIQWAATEEYADLIVADDPVIRVWVP